MRGLTTAAAIWVTAAIGAAAGAGLPVLAMLTTGIYFVVALAFPAVTRRLPRSSTAISALQVRYPDGRGILRQVLQATAALDFTIDDVSTETVTPRSPARPGSPARPAIVEVTLHVHGRQPVNELASALSELDDVDVVRASDVHAIDE